jgi:hypothetical protein
MIDGVKGSGSAAGVDFFLEMRLAPSIHAQGQIQ